MPSPSPTKQAWHYRHPRGYLQRHEKHAEIQEINVGNRHELFLLDEGQEKVTWEWDTR